MNNINIKKPSLINSNFNDDNKENNRLTFNKNIVTSLKKFEFFNDDPKPFPEFEKSSEKEAKFKNTSELLDDDRKPFQEIIYFSELPEKQNKINKKINKENKSNAFEISKFGTPDLKLEKQPTVNNLKFITPNKFNSMSDSLSGEEVLFEFINTITDLNETFIESLVKIIGKDNTERPSTPYHYPQNIAFHHTIDIWTLLIIFKNVLEEKKDIISNEEKKKLIISILLQLSKNKIVLKNRIRDYVFTALKKLINLETSKEGIALTVDEEDALLRVFSYFFGVGFIGPDEQYRIDELRAHQNFDALARYFINREHYEKLKKLSESNDTKEKYNLLLDISKITPNLNYEADKWSSTKIGEDSRHLLYPKELQEHLKKYFQLYETNHSFIKEIKELEEIIKSKQKEGKITNKNQLMGYYIKYITSENEIVKFLKDNNIIKNNKEISIKNFDNIINKIEKYRDKYQNELANLISAESNNNEPKSMESKLKTLKEDFNKIKSDFDLEKINVSAYVNKTPDTHGIKSKDKISIYKISK